METTDLHASEEPPAPEARDESMESYEPPSFTELGSFLDLTAGPGGAGGDLVATSSPL